MMINVGGMAELKIVYLSPELIPQALEISKVEFGIDYFYEKDLLDCIGKEDVFCKTAIIGDEVVGFCICRLFGPEKVDEELKLPDSKDRDMMLSFERIGLLDAMAFRSDMQGHGYGTVLADACYSEILSRGADCVCAMAWKSIRGTTNAKRLLENLGMRSGIEIQGYWNLMVDSPEGHHCPHCDPPCKCFGVLYYKAICD